DDGTVPEDAGESHVGADADADADVEADADADADTSAGRSWEVLGRGLVALPKDGHAYLSWRLLPWDAPDTGFHAYRSEALDGPYVRVSDGPIDRTTDYDDVTAVSGRTYFYLVRSVSPTGLEGPDSNVARVTAGASQNSVAIPLLGGLEPPESAAVTWALDGSWNNVGVGDINGDGVFDFAVLSSARSVETGEQLTPYHVEVVLSGSGTWSSRWRVSTGFQPSAFAVNASLVLWDLDGDGRAEIVARTGAEGHLSVLDPDTGAVLASHSWPADAGPFYTLAAAYLEDADGDGVPDPFIVAQHGMAFRFAAFTYDAATGLSLHREVVPVEPPDERHPWISAMGTHGLPIADIDGDGFDELLPCGSVLDTDWGGYSVVYPNHADVCFPADIAPGTPGLELFVAECNSPNGGLSNFGSGRPAELWSVHADCPGGWDKGWCADLTTTRPGLECALLEMECDFLPRPHLRTRVFDAAGNEITDEFALELQYHSPVDWVRGDGVKEILNANCGPAAPPDCMPGRVADYVGDAREESIWWDTGAGLLRIFSNLDSNAGRAVTPLADRGYRAAVARHGAYGYSTNWIAQRTNQPRFDLRQAPGPVREACDGMPAGTPCR
ncbi:MAG: hypothetical protein QME96_16270, partial [Myxococcota bacterium]|nr:hypothetical protein [Myxococcota bacterium]